MNTVKLAQKLLNNELWPIYLKLALIERKRNLWSSDLGPVIKQGDDYTFQQQATVDNNVPKDFKEINDFKAFSRKIKGFYKDKALLRVLSLSWIFFISCPTMQLQGIATACCCSRFNFDSVLYLSLQPLILLNAFSNGQLMYILYLLVSHIYSSWPYMFPCQRSLTYKYTDAYNTLFQYLYFSNYLRSPYIYHVYFCL